MALSAELGKAGLTADRIDTSAAVAFENNGVGFSIAEVHLTVMAKVPGAKFVP